MQKLLLVVALSVALLGSATAARPAQASDSMCSLPANWDQVDFAAQALASVNSACPSAAGLQNEEDDTCVPCVCGAYQLFSGALDHPVIRSDDRSKMTSPMSISLFGEVFNSCIDNNAKKFVKPLDIQSGLSDCLSSTDSPVKNGAQLAALCTAWNAQSQQATNSQEKPMDVIPDAQAVDEHVRSMIEGRMLQEESSAAPVEESSTDGGVVGVYPPPPYPPSPPRPRPSPPNPPGVYPAPAYPPSVAYPPGAAYPPGVAYPPTYPLPPAPPGGYSPPPPVSPPPGPSAAGITMAGMMPLIMGLVSAFLMATMML